MSKLNVMTENELKDINGGGKVAAMWGVAVAFGSLLCKVAKEGFKAGRQIVRDVRS